MSSSTKILEIRFLGQKMSFKAPIQSVIYPSDISLSLICQCLEISPGNYLNKKDKGWYSMNLLTFSLFSRLYRDIISSQRNIKIFKLSQRNIKIFKLRILIPFLQFFFLFWRIDSEGESTFSEGLKRNNKEFKNELEWFDCMLTYCLRDILPFFLF